MREKSAGKKYVLKIEDIDLIFIKVFCTLYFDKHLFAYVIYVDNHFVWILVFFVVGIFTYFGSMYFYYWDLVAAQWPTPNPGTLG